jgi:hypothetical protein
VAWDAVPEPMVEYIDPGFLLVLPAVLSRPWAFVLDKSTGQRVMQELGSISNVNLSYLKSL